MGYQNKFLFRESMQDTGVIPTSNSIYWSPDIICHKQVANAKQFFTDNYSIKDVADSVDLGTSINFIYARVKNLGADSTPVTGYVNVYRSDSSLFMQPSLWSKTPLTTTKNNFYIRVNSSTPGEILVEDEMFLLSGLKNNLFCMMGIVSDSPTPTIPDKDFSSYDDFIYWLRTNQAVCARNLNKEPNCIEKNYERLDHFSNPEKQPVEVYFRVEASNMYDKTVFGIICDPLKIGKEWVYDSSSSSNKYSVLGDVPADFSGYISVYAILPAGYSVWPDKAEISIIPLTAMVPQNKSYCFGMDPVRSEVNHKLLRSMTPVHRLVQLGCCTSVFSQILR